MKRIVAGMHREEEMKRQVLDYRPAGAAPARRPLPWADAAMWFIVVMFFLLLIYLAWWLVFGIERSIGSIGEGMSSSPVTKEEGAPSVH